MLKVGGVVRCVAGHDKDRFYLVVKSQKDCVWIADGKLRKLATPKRKNVKHLRDTKQEIDLSTVTTDKKLRTALAPLNGEIERPWPFKEAISGEEGGIKLV